MRRLLAVVCVAVPLAGCGGGGLHETARVTGTVTWNGEPVTGGVVYSSPEKGPQATGTIDDEGNFALVTAGLGHVAVLGKHTVHLGPPAPPDDGEPQLDETGYPLPIPVVDWPVDDEYRDPTRSVLSFEVTADGPNKWVIELPK